MPYQTLSITRSNQREESSAYVLLEQEPWDQYVGMLTKGGVVAYLNNLLFGDEKQEEDCGVAEDGTISSLIYAYPSPASLNYRIAISHGELGERIVDEVEYAEILQIQMEQNPTLRYPTSSIISATWVTDSFATDGEALARPAISIAGGRIFISKSVYGTILVIYRVIRHTYDGTILPRPDAAENKYQSFVYAVWDGGNNVIEYQLPADAEDGGKCNNRYKRGQGGTEPPKDCEPPIATPEDISVDVDYCSGKVLK